LPLRIPNLIKSVIFRLKRITVILILRELLFKLKVNKAKRISKASCQEKICLKIFNLSELRKLFKSK